MCVCVDVYMHYELMLYASYSRQFYSTQFKVTNALYISLTNVKFVPHITSSNFHAFVMCFVSCLCVLDVRTVSVVEDEVWQEVERRVIKEFGDKNKDQNMSLVRECLKKRDHITVFRQDGGSSGKDIDVAILRALLKGRRTDCDCEDCL